MKVTPRPRPRIDLVNDKLYSRAEAAALVGLSEKTLRQLAVTRSGPKVLKLGTSRTSRVLYRRSDLERWMESRAVEVS